MRRLLPRAVVIALVILAIVIVAVSPFVLDDFGGSPAAWARRADIGQTYGAAAALLAVLALAGVAASLVLQARETKVNREHNSRQVHNQLMRTVGRQGDGTAYRRVGRLRTGGRRRGGPAVATTTLAGPPAVVGGTRSRYGR